MGFTGRVPKWILTLYPMTQNKYGFLRSSPTSYMWCLKVIGQNPQCVLYPQCLVHGVPKRTLIFDPVTQNQYALSCHHAQLTHLKMNGLKLQSVSRPQVLIERVPNLTLIFDPMTPPPPKKKNRVPPLIMNNLHVKFESDRANKNCSLYLVERLNLTTHSVASPRKGPKLRSFDPMTLNE